MTLAQAAESVEPNSTSPPSSPDGATEFEFGLQLILDGLERLRDTG